MNLLIVGGSGFVGKSFIDGYNRGILKSFDITKVYILCRNTNIIKKNCFLDLKKIKLIKGDISTIKKLPNCNVIIYCADTTNVQKYKKLKNKKIKSLKPIDNFCEIVQKMKKTKILYLSSGSVYGIQSSNKKKISEKNQSNINYKSSNYKFNYSKIKLYSEKKIISLGQKGIKTSIARCFSFIGTWLPKNKQYIVGNFLYDGYKSNKIKVNSKYNVIRSYMHADDMIYWLMKIAISSNNKCEIYNVGSDESVNTRYLSKIIGQIFSKPVVSKKITNGKIDCYVPNVNKAKRQLNLKIKHDLRTSINLVVKNTIW